MNRIILLGFRYCGKSMIGRQLATMNGLGFVDVDAEVERHEGKKITEIVEKNGWKYFRKLEFECYKNLLYKEDILIACGGGFAVNEYFANEEKQLLTQDKGLKILLMADEDAIKARIIYDFQNNKNDGKRPSFGAKNNHLDGVIKSSLATFNKRKKLYDNLDYDCKIDTSNIKIATEISKHTLCCVVGYPVWHSLSPKIHNFLYDMQNLDNFVYTKCEIKPEKIDKLKEIIKFFNFRGLSITSPYKQEVMKIVDVLDEKAKQIGAVNTIFVDNKGKIYGYNTDYIGVLNALENKTILTNKMVAIFGSGGGAKSAVVACLEKTKNITLFNRTKEKNDDFATQNNIKSCSLAEFKPENFDIIINATIVGLGEQTSILKSNQILKNHIVFDMVYNPLKTKLLKYAIKKGARIIYGIDMLIFQAIKQHEIYAKQQVNSRQIRKIQDEIIQKKHDTCCVVIGNTINKLLKNLKIAQQKSDFIELRCDYLNKINKIIIDKIAENICVDIIFTCRNTEDGGNFKGTFQEQQEIIKYAMSLNKFTYFDIDFSQVDSWKSELSIKNRSYKIILSHHNFKKCLSYKKCITIIDEMFKSDADIAKIACKINSTSCISTMLKVLEKYKKENKNVIFAPMCEEKIIRLLASKYGSWTNFVCLNDKENTAKGQICVDDYIKIVDLLNIRDIYGRQ